MDKKVFKMYETPAVEIVELEVEAQILAGSDTNAEGIENGDGQVGDDDWE